MRYEQGLGDTLQFIRYARLVKERGATVVVECQQSVARLVAGCAGVDRVVEFGQPLGEFDAFVPLLSLPRVFGTTLETIPAAQAYLEPEGAAVERWHQELAGYEGLKIGIAWQGSMTNIRDKFRSMRLAEFAPLAELAGVQLFSLQMGPGPRTSRRARRPLAAGRFGRPPGRFRRNGRHHSQSRPGGHLRFVHRAPGRRDRAAGVGRLALVARLALDARRQDSPWYPTMRLFRQPTEGDWPGVFQRIAAAIGER